eukprot:312813-Pyramimonas_sp.AAC.1
MMTPPLLSDLGGRVAECTYDPPYPPSAERIGGPCGGLAGGGVRHRGGRGGPRGGVHLRFRRRPLRVVGAAAVAGLLCAGVPRP